MADPDWAVYTSSEDGRFATTMVDLQWHARGADPQRPVWIEVSVPLRTADKDGLPEGAEMRSLEPLDESLQAAMARAVDAVPVGAATAGGWRRWFFYARTGNVESAARGAFERGGYEPQWRSEDDPAWNNYRKRLYPTPDQLRWIEDLKIVLMLRQEGDDGRRHRQIDHWSYFDDRCSAERFARWCGDNGFALDGEEQAKTSADGKFGVHFFHVGPAMIDVINERTVAADRATRQFGGEYDGWGAPVLRRRWWRFWG